MLDVTESVGHTDTYNDSDADAPEIIRRGVSVSMDPATAARELYDAMYQADMSLGIFYCSPQYDLPELGQELQRLFGSANLIGCTTAGEITPSGYLNGAITGVSISNTDFKSVTKRVDNLESFEVADGQVVAEAAISALEDSDSTPSAKDTFGLILVDGLSCREEAVVSSIHQNCGGIQIFGGSAGDGVDFGATYLYHEGEFRTDCALFTLVQTDHPFTVFKTQHFVETDKKMVVTKAAPDVRVVTEINGLPAGREYARMVGLDMKELTPLIFSTYPVVVKIGGEFFVRSIQKVNEDESLSFFCAIDEGIVLTVAQGIDLVENLEELFEDVAKTVGPPELVLGCDCILRHLEIDQKQLKERVQSILTKNNVIGFSTYGEQYNAMHVNQTFTGVAIGSRTRA